MLHYKPIGAVGQPELRKGMGNRVKAIMEKAVCFVVGADFSRCRFGASFWQKISFLRHFYSCFFISREVPLSVLAIFVVLQFFVRF